MYGNYSRDGMKNKRYSMSFTTASLLRTESVTLATVYLDLRDWTLVREKVASENLLQARTLNTSRRFCSEIISRLKTLSDAEIGFLTKGTFSDQGYILWLAICRRYEFIADFAVEVLRERFCSLKTDLHQEDYDAFFNLKSEWHPELDSLSPATRKKLRQVLFKMLRESDFLSKDMTIKAAMLSPEILEVLSLRNHQDTQFFPAFDGAVKRGTVGE